MYYATAKEMEKLDKSAVADGLEILQMMELAGWQMLNLFKILNVSKSSKVLVVCGKGNKGGDGLSAARHLINYGWKVKILLISRKISKDAEHHLKLLKKIPAEVLVYKNENQAKKIIQASDIIIDSLIGYHLNGAPRKNFKNLIGLINKFGKKVISYDLPTGLDATSGNCPGVCVSASTTLALALPKKAFLKSRKLCGKIYLADIGIPKFLYDEIKRGIRPKFNVNNKLIKL